MVPVFDDRRATRQAASEVEVLAEPRHWCPAGLDGCEHRVVDRPCDVRVRSCCRGSCSCCVRRRVAYPAHPRVYTGGECIRAKVAGRWKQDVMKIGAPTSGTSASTTTPSHPIVEEFGVPRGADVERAGRFERRSMAQQAQRCPVKPGSCTRRARDQYQAREYVRSSADDCRMLSTRVPRAHVGRGVVSHRCARQCLHEPFEVRRSSAGFDSRDVLRSAG